MAANAWVAREDVNLTYDVDVAIFIPDAAGFSPERIAGAVAASTGTGCFHGSTPELPRAKIVRLVTTPEGTVLDMVVADPAYASTALSRCGSVELAGERFALLAPEDVVLYKSLAQRDKDRTAISAIARTQKLDQDYLANWSRHLGTWEFLAPLLGRGNST